MQTSKNLKRLLSAVLAVVMMLTAIPFATSAEEEVAAAKDTLVFGQFGENALVWEILEKEADGDLLLVTRDAIEKVKFDTVKPPKFVGGALYTALEAFYSASFSDAEKAAIAQTTVSYVYWDKTAAAKTTGEVSANVVIPTPAMQTKYSLGKVNLIGTTTACAYYLTDARANNATDAVITAVSTAGALSNAPGAPSKAATAYRAVITLKSGNYAQFPAVDGVSYTVSGEAVTYYATVADTAFSVAVDTENYDADEIAVSLGDSALTAADGVYTIPAGATAEVAVSGVKAQPADFTAYNEAVAKANEVDRDLCDTTDLDAALAVDVSACTKLEQAKVDEAAAAILDAIANLKYKPADLTEYNKALELARKAFNDKNGEYYSIKETEPESQTSYELLLWDLLDKYEDDTDTPISSLTIDKQDEVDAATKALNDFVASIPLKRADTSKWSEALRLIKNIKPDLYSNAAELIAEAEALVAENDYATMNPDITYQAEIDAATEALKAIYAKRIVIPSDFTALDAALALAETLLEENYYKDEELAEIYNEEEIKQLGSGTKAWEDFVAQRDAALAIDRSLYTTAAEQKTIDGYTEALVRAMALLEPFTRLTPWQEFWKPVTDFFEEVATFFGMVGGILKFVGDIIKNLIKGDIEFDRAVWDILDMVGVSDDVIATVEKIIPRPAE